MADVRTVATINQSSPEPEGAVTQPDSGGVNPATVPTTPVPGLASPAYQPGQPAPTGEIAPGPGRSSVHPVTER